MYFKKYTVHTRLICFWVCFLILFFRSALILAQNIPTSDGLVSYFPFDKYPIVDSSGGSNKAIFNGDSTLGCGVTGQSIRLDGINTEVYFIGPAYFDNFKIGDFTFSFYFKANQLTGNATLDLFSKRKNCTQDSSFAIRYTPATNTLSVELTENALKGHVMTQRLDYNRCWQNITIVRNYTRLLLYVNGKLVQQNASTKRVNISNDKPLAIAASPCLSSTDRKFGGYIDEIRLYDRPLSDLEVAGLYFAPDKLATHDTIIFLGATVPLRTTQTCAKDFSWIPKEIISDPKAENPTATPTVGGTYTVKVVMKEAQCTAIDSLHLKVIDTKDLDCNKVFLPNAFTPNGDGDNDKFFISNPYALDALTVFEVFDPWGNRVFSTTDKFEGWDGSVNSKILSSGVFLWKVRYLCKGQELQQFGSVTILR